MAIGVRRMRLRWGLAGLAFAMAFAAGFALVRGLAPERLRRETEVRLAEALGGPVEVGRLRIAPGLGLRLHAEAVTAWPAEAGPRLKVERVEARLRPFAFLTGGPLFGALRLDGARLALERSRAGAWEPPPLADLAEPRPSQPAASLEPWLAPVAAIESLARALLEGPGFADDIELHGASIAFRDAKPPDGGRVSLEIQGLEARLRRHRILGGADLFLRGRLLEGGVERGTLEILGSRSRDGGVEIALATAAFDLATLARYLPLQEPRVPIAGTLSGYLGSKSPEPGQNQVEVDLVISGLRSVIPGFDEGEPRPIDARRIDLAGFLDVSAGRIVLRDLRFENGRLRLELAGQIARPLGAGSAAELSLGLRDLEVDELRDLLAWLPEVRREQATRGLERIEAGRLANFQVDGSASLADWQAFLSGRRRELPERFSLQADVAETRLRVGDSDRLEALSGHLAWTGERVEVTGARAALKGNPLPVLDLTLYGVSNFLAGDPERRRLAPGGEPLRGLDALFDVMAGDPEKETPPLETRVRVEIDALDHPVLLWPLEQVAARVELGAEGVRVEELRGVWAGVPISGEAVFAQRPERTAKVEVVAEPPLPTPSVAHGPGWARGRFEVERLATRVWSHEHAIGRFTAHAARFDFEDVEASLAPSGRLRGTASLDLARAGSVAYRASFQVEQGDVPGIARVLGLPEDFATGQIELAGSFEGMLAPSVPASTGLTGLLSVRARDGEIRRVLPAVVAIALASRSFNPFTGREQIRYDRAETVLEFADGSMHTEALSIDGPDLRVFASGDLSLASPAHEVDAHVVLFLFRQIDSVIGKIPVLNLLLLGTNENLLAAYFDLTGPWAEPEANLVPLRSLAAGPASLVLEGVPFLVRKGLEAIGALDGEAGGAPARPFSPEPPPRKDS
jgi:hypothetical protein